MTFKNVLQCVAALCAWVAMAQADSITMKEALVCGPMPPSGRDPFRRDPIEQSIVTGRWTTPKNGDLLELSPKDQLNPQTRVWVLRSAEGDGFIGGDELAGGYVAWTVESRFDRVALLEARGHSMVYVNGEPRGGDPYGTGSIVVPVQLHTGLNELVFAVGRGRVQAALVEPKAPFFFDLRDVTAPDLVLDHDNPGLFVAVPLVNASEEPLEGLVIRAEIDCHEHASPCPPIPALSTRKIAIPIPQIKIHAAGPVKLTLHLDQKTGPNVSATEIELRTVSASERRKVTFLSEIDGSVQYFSLVPPSEPQDSESGNDGKLGLILSLHGASVEATSQAGAYAPKPWCWIACPTNRRPFGFDWEDWGRRDAVEVLDHVMHHMPEVSIDPSRVWLTGHSMGGHGTWQVGAHFPGRFAAIAPSAGWISFWSYVSGPRAENPGAIEDIFRRASSPSDTLALASNYRQLGVYILHGDADDNVPVEQARAMRKVLGEFHPDFCYYEQPGAGHWWGNQCVDWPPLMEFLQRHTIISNPDTIEFTTAHPGVSSACHWAAVEQAAKPMSPSSVSLKRSSKDDAVSVEGATGNVAAMTLAVDRPASVTLDGDAISIETAHIQNGRVTLRKVDGHWQATDPIDPNEKTPARCGPFKAAFDHGMIFVVATHGTFRENAWSLAKARYDAEQWWMRGNGSVEIMNDDVVLAAATTDLAAHNLILYGHADMNSAWALLSDSPVTIHRGRAVVGGRTVEGDDLAMLMVRPRLGNGAAPNVAIGVVAGSGMSGLRLTERMSYFTSGVAYPDLMIARPAILETGPDGVVMAGFFGNDWSVERGDWAWAGPATSGP